MIADITICRKNDLQLTITRLIIDSYMIIKIQLYADEYYVITYKYTNEL